jgi:hypothetical protein
MKRTISAVLTGVAALTVLVVIQGCGVLGGPPTGVAVSAGPGESDSTVLVSWTTPAEGSPDKYMVYFRAGTDSGYTVLGETTGTSYAHNPHGVTGQYKVSAVFGGDSYYGAEQPTTVPIKSDAALFEINADSSRCAFGWSRDSGIGKTYAMTESVNCTHVDFYVSDLQAGVGGALDIVSPNKAHPDSGASIDTGAVGIVPRAAWKTNGFSNPVLTDTVPSYQAPPNANYFIYTQITTQPCYFGCYTAGDTVKHYALIQVDSADVTAGKVWLQSWYQLVPGLRLVRH